MRTAFNGAYNDYAFAMRNRDTLQADLSLDKIVFEATKKVDVGGFEKNILPYSTHQHQLLNAHIKLCDAHVAYYAADNGKDKIGKQGSYVIVLPNPTAGLVIVEQNVTENPIDISIYDLKGNTVYTQYFTGVALPINISRLAAGMYIINVTDATNGTTLHHGKLFKE